jgi:hypothetical protein
MAIRQLETSVHWFHQTRFQRRPECRLWVLKAIHVLKKFVKVALFNAQHAKNDFARPCDTLIHRFINHKSFFWRPGGRLWVLRPIRLLKHHLSDFEQVVFFDTQNAGNDFKWSSDTLIHRFIHFTKVVFKTSRRQIMTISRPFEFLKHHLCDFVQVAFFDPQDAELDFTWPFNTLDKPPKSLCKNSRRQIMSSQCYKPT